MCVLSVFICKSEAEETKLILSGKHVSGYYYCVVNGGEGRVMKKLEVLDILLLCTINALNPHILEPVLNYCTPLHYSCIT